MKIDILFVISFRQNYLLGSRDTCQIINTTKWQLQKLCICVIFKRFTSMFSSQKYLDKKTGPYGIGRFSYLQSIVTEYQDTDSAEAKQQILANLANFAYDPINYEYMRQLNVLDLFLDVLREGSEKYVEYAIGGICNICLDKTNKEYILKNEGVPLILNCLSSTNEEVVLSAITTLMFLITPKSKPDIISLPVLDAMLRFSKSQNPRFSNLASVFLKDYCTEEQVNEALQAQAMWEQQDTQATEPS